MFITSETAYKSIEPIQRIELPDFVILSGLNGGGKTQLLVGISQGLIHIHEGGQQLQPVKFVDHNTLAPNDSVIASREMVRQSIQEAFNRYSQFGSVWNRARHRAGLDLVQDKQWSSIIQRIAESAGKDIEILTNEDFLRHYPLEDDVGQKDIFHHNFSMLFKRYQIKKDENEFDQFRSQKYGGISFLSDEDFLKRYGEPPWIFVNQIIAEADLDYRINSPDDHHLDAPFELKLISNLNKAQINFSDLSSGEKVIMSLALSLYNSKFDVEFPKVLVMVEPESHLHPSMTKKFLDVIHNVFVQEKGVKVIMTTHSPSTVALAPEESLFLMNKTAPRISKATKDNALRILTSGVPTLSISYENRRQVFVESKHDVAFYEKAYEKLRDKLIPEISVNFISSGIGGYGNCDQVKQIVNTLTGYGNRSIFGIIDWDTKNTGNEFVKVLGKDKRYSVENYIFDPILLIAFLLREKFIERTALGLVESDRYTDLSNFDNAKLQSLADFLVGKIAAQVGNSFPGDLEQVEYVGGHKISLPVWFLRIQGHTLESLIKELFPPLKGYQREGELKREIINKVIDDIPGFISTDVLVVMSEIQQV